MRYDKITHWECIQEILILGLPYSVWLACEDIGNFVPGLQGTFFIDFKPENISFYTINFSQKRDLETDFKISCHRLLQRWSVLQITIIRKLSLNYYRLSKLENNGNHEEKSSPVYVCTCLAIPVVETRYIYVFYG